MACKLFEIQGSILISKRAQQRAESLKNVFKLIFGGGITYSCFILQPFIGPTRQLG